MDAVHAILRRLRNWFLVWFVAEAIVGTAAAADVLDAMSRHWFWNPATGGVGAAGTVPAGLAVSLMLLLLAWAMFKALLNLKPWARMVMLVIGWITVVSAALSLLTLPATSVLLESVEVLTGADWAALVAMDVATKIAGLAFWSWAIYVLQRNPAVRAAFACRTAPSGHVPAGPGVRVFELRLRRARPGHLSGLGKEVHRVHERRGLQTVGDEQDISAYRSRAGSVRGAELRCGG